MADLLIGREVLGVFVEQRIIDAIERETQARDLKPDGWHTYHVCGGKLRELVWQRDGHEATCVTCGTWFSAVIRPAAREGAEGG